MPNRKSTVNNDKGCKTTMATTGRKGDERSEVNQGNKLFAYGTAEASSFIEMEVHGRCFSPQKKNMAS